jgi:hypothetical protein
MSAPHSGQYLHGSVNEDRQRGQTKRGAGVCDDIAIRDLTLVAAGR